jgi:hypothetical protein
MVNEAANDTSSSPMIQCLNEMRRLNNEISRLSTIRSCTVTLLHGFVEHVYTQRRHLLHSLPEAQPAPHKLPTTDHLQIAVDSTVEISGLHADELAVETAQDEADHSDDSLQTDDDALALDEHIGPRETESNDLFPEPALDACDDSTEEVSDAPVQTIADLLAELEGPQKPDEPDPIPSDTDAEPPPLEPDDAATGPGDEDFAAQLLAIARQEPMPSADDESAEYISAESPGADEPTPETPIFFENEADLTQEMPLDEESGRAGARADALDLLDAELDSMVEALSQNDSQEPTESSAEDEEATETEAMDVPSPESVSFGEAVDDVPEPTPMPLEKPLDEDDENDTIESLYDDESSIKDELLGQASPPPPAEEQDAGDESDAITSNQQAVDDYIALTAPAVVGSVKAAYISRATNGERGRQQLVRSLHKLFNAFADIIYPPREEPITVQGRSWDLGPTNHLNRIYAFSFEHCGDGDKDLRRSISRIYRDLDVDMHGELSLERIEAIVASTYDLLYEILSLAEEPSEAAD